ncbi:MAG: hypothetical protein WBM86_01850 [Waterburya sp.]
MVQRESIQARNQSSSIDELGYYETQQYLSNGHQDTYLLTPVEAG